MAKILIVDDDDQLRQTIQMVLKLKGYEAIEANDGESALQSAQSNLPDLIISDINMPGKDGFQALKQLRTNPLTAAIPMILMTGESEGTMRRGMELGADDFLNKPFSMPDLLKAIDARLKKVEAVKQVAETKLAELRANISLMLPHELNTPLVGILGFGEIIHTCADSLSPAELQEMGKNILDSGLRLQKLIQNFLVFAQLEMIRADDKEIAAMRAKVTEDVAQIATLALRAKAEEFGRMADLKEGLQPCSARIADDLLSKVIEELTSNAFKFSTAGKPVTVSCSSDGRQVLIEIEDQGRGMKPEQVRNIDAYAQFDRRRHEQQGSGLGLAIARLLVQLHGGTLTVRSQENAGTSVTVKLPAAA